MGISFLQKGLLWIEHPPDEEERAGGDIADEKEEGVVDGQDDILHRHGSYAHEDYGCCGGFRALLIHGDEGLMNGIPNVQGARAVHAREIRQVRDEGIRHAQLGERLAQPILSCQS